MRTLPSPEKLEWLLAFDFDDTLSTPDTQPSVPNDFFKRIEELRTSQHCCWGINTGRSLMQVVEGMNEAKFPFLPDFIIAREREIYTANNYGRWISVEPWNKRCAKEHERLFKKNRRLIKRLKEWVEKETDGVWGEQKGEPAGIVATTIEEMNHIVDKLDEQFVGTPLLTYQHNAIYLRLSHDDYNKGSALAEVGRLSGISSEKTFAIGDAQNDLDMMDLNIAAHLACPSNACPEVKNRIEEVGGYIAQAAAGKGSIEALNHLFPRVV